MTPEQTKAVAVIPAKSPTFRQNAAKYGLVPAIAGWASGANAAIDVSGVTDLVDEAIAAALLIGVAYLGFIAGISIYKKLRGAAT